MSIRKQLSALQFCYTTGMATWNSSEELGIKLVLVFSIPDSSSHVWRRFYCSWYWASWRAL